MESRKKALRRLKIISGQVHGLINLIENEKDCEKIFPQIKAVKNAFNGFSAQVTKDMITECFAEKCNFPESKEREKFEKMIEKFSEL